MTSLLERSILMTIGAAAITRDMAEALTNGFVHKGEEAAAEGRQAVDELVGKAREEARGVRGKIDDNLRRTFTDLGLADSGRLEELELKMAQLEHRLSLLEGGKAEQGRGAPGAKAASAETAGEEPGDTGGEEEEEEEPVTEG